MIKFLATLMPLRVNADYTPSVVQLAAISRGSSYNSSKKKKERRDPPPLRVPSHNTYIYDDGATVINTNNRNSSVDFII